MPRSPPAWRRRPATGRSWRRDEEGSVPRPHRGHCRVRRLGLVVGLAFVLPAVIAAPVAGNGFPVEPYPATDSVARLGPATVGAGGPSAPLVFEANVGQLSTAISFRARGDGFELLLTGGEAVFAPTTPTGGLGDGMVRMRFVGADSAAVLAGEDAKAGTVSYLLGADPGDWRTGIATYGAVRAIGVYPGVDVVYHGRNGRLEYDVVVAPGVDPEVVRVEFAGAVPRI